jgi:hypothetical protein
MTRARFEAPRRRMAAVSGMARQEPTKSEVHHVATWIFAFPHFRFPIAVVPGAMEAGNPQSICRKQGRDMPRNSTPGRQPSAFFMRLWQRHVVTVRS